MERLYVYNGALAIIGLSLGVPAMRSLISGDQSIPILLMAIGGCGLIISASYELLRTDPDDFTVSTAVLIASVGGACMAVLGTILSMISGM